MCGIAGCLRGKPFGVQELKGMLDRMVHRGPDSEGVYQSSDKTYCAGMRRLSINDLATGDQPLFNEDRSVALVYNGEIYNYRSVSRHTKIRSTSCCNYTIIILSIYTLDSCFHVDLHLKGHYIGPVYMLGAAVSTI